LTKLKQQEYVFGLAKSAFHLHKITDKILKDQYETFDPIAILQQIVKEIESTKNYDLINYLSSEVHDTSYLLSFEEKIELFNDYDSLNKLWKEDFITDHQGKLRIFLLCMVFLENKKK
jgi:uncharacterized HAD superfamily protein